MLFMRTRTTLISLVLAALALGCGHSEAEWKGQLDKNALLSQQRDDLSQKNEGLSKELEEAKKHVDDLEGQLKSKGVEVSKLNMTLEDREKALKAYKERAATLEAI